MDEKKFVEKEKIVGIINSLYNAYKEEKNMSLGEDTTRSTLLEEKIEKYLDLL